VHGDVRRLDNLAFREKNGKPHVTSLLSISNFATALSSVSFQKPSRPKVSRLNATVHKQRVTPP
jgi:hypothetical protein